MTLLLGCIADDFTGGTDLAGMLVKAGMRTVQMIGIPDTPVGDDVDAVVIALKSRTTPAADAVSESLGALRWLQRQGCRQFYFKYCSTFDSTEKGNIGPVADALMDALDCSFTIACPAFPANGRTIYKGHLFVGNLLLSESGMRNHPLTPMRDANLVRVLQSQIQGKVGMVDIGIVRQGVAAVRARFSELQTDGCKYAVTDAISNDDLTTLGAACAEMSLVTGGSGIALGLPQNFRQAGLLAANPVADALPPTGGLRAVLCGSCSAATQEQVAAMRAKYPAFAIDPVELAQGADVVGAALDWARGKIDKEPVLFYATATPETVQRVQALFGVERAGRLVEDAMAALAKGLIALGVGQLIVAGGETSGAVVKAIGVSGLRIGPEIDPGVPWTVGILSTGNERAGVSTPIVPIALALKSGNFGTPDFFLKAWNRLPS